MDLSILYVLSNYAKIYLFLLGGNILKEEYIVYCDESAKNGKYFGNFYGGAIVNSKRIDILNSSLNKKKEELNLFGEIKWSKVTESYLNKYIEIIDLFF